MSALRSAITRCPRAFYTKALAPLGYEPIIEIEGKDNASSYPAIGFGIGKKAGFLDRRRGFSRQAAACRHRCGSARAGERLPHGGARSRREG
jgi:hypothetical protein